MTGIQSEISMKHQHRSKASALLPVCRRFVLLASLCIACAVEAAEPAEGLLSLRDAIDATLQANPQLEVYRFREQALDGQRTTAALRPPLQVNGGVEDALGSGAVQEFRRAEFTLSLSRVIELGDQRDARVNVTSQRIDLLRAEQRVTELDLLAEVARRFIATAAAQQQLALQQRATALAQQTLDALQPLVEAGQTPASEQARASAALERARLSTAHAQATLAAARIDLASMWANDAPAFSGVGAELLQVGDAGALNDLLMGLQQNPDILLFAGEERLLDAQVREAHSERRGTVQWTAGLRHLREAGDTAFVFGASMPLGSRERANGAIATAQAGLQEVASRRAVALNRMQAQLRGLHLQLTQALLEVNTLRDAVLPQLDSALQQTREAYLGGRYSYVDLVSAQQEYLDAERALIDAATDAHLLRVEIERLSGAELDSQNPATQAE
jgi:cobalt-zinc-cadmium efflux system outer membrane protein